MNRHHIDIHGRPVPRQREISPLAALVVYLVVFSAIGVLMFAGVFTGATLPDQLAIAPAVNWTVLPTTCGGVSP